MLKYLELAVCGTNLKPNYPFIGSTIRGTFGHALRYARAALTLARNAIQCCKK